MPEPNLQDQEKETRATNQDQRTATSDIEQGLAQAEARTVAMREALLNMQTEIARLQRRALQDLAHADRFAIEDFAKALLPFKDNLETALAIDTSALASLKEGVEMTLKQLHAAFERHGLLEISPASGDRFDPLEHQATVAITGDRTEHTIVGVQQTGYRIGDRLLRPAQVVVAQSQDGH